MNKLFSSKSVTKPWTKVRLSESAVAHAIFIFYFFWRWALHSIFSSHTKPLWLNSSIKDFCSWTCHFMWQFFQNLRRWIVCFLQLGCIKSFEFCFQHTEVISISIPSFMSVILSDRHLYSCIHDYKIRT